MKKIFFAALCGMMALSACDNYDDIVPQKYDKIVSLKEYGELSMALYNTGLPTEYDLTILKGGAKPELEANVKLSAMNDVQFADYLDETGHAYLKLPEECYSFENAQLDFSSADRYKKAKVIIYTEKVAPYLEGMSAEHAYVIPVILTSDNDSILATANNLIIKPSGVVTPSVSFTSNQNSGGYTKELGATGGVVSIPLKMQIDNLWDFDVRVEADPATTTAPEGSFEILNDGLVTFDASSSTASVQVKFNNLQQIINQVGLRIAGIDGMAFDYDKNVFPLTVKKEKYPLTIGMLYTNAQEPSEGPLANVLDNNVNTFFHTAWSVSVTGNHYVQVTLPESFHSFVFEYTNRSSNGNAALAYFNVYAGPDADNLKKVRYFTVDNDNLPTGGAGSYTSPELNLNNIEAYDTTEPAKVIRFECIKNYTNGIFWVWSTFGLRII
jgi:hypothetical protein